MSRSIWKAYISDGTTTALRIAKAGSADGKAAQASAGTDALLGVIKGEKDQTFADGKTISVCEFSDEVEVEFGGTVNRGGPVTADANGKAVAAASTNLVIGYARKTYNSGQIGRIFCCRQGVL